MSKYEIQREIFRIALATGWDGKGPIQLANRYSEKSFYEAMAYIIKDPQGCLAASLKHF
jgi:hypothetical protein